MATPVRRSPSSSSGLATRSWDPLQHLEEVQARMSQLMQGAWPGLPVDRDTPWVPPVDIEETDDAWVVEAELPGVRREDINVEVQDDELRVSGEIKERERKGILRRRERRVGEFELRVTLPGAADREHIEASLDDGVLRIRLPKQQQEQRQTRRIEIAR
jgi:HSP20 family protein